MQKLLVLSSFIAEMLMQSKQLLAYILILYQGIFLSIIAKGGLLLDIAVMLFKSSQRWNGNIPDINYGITDHQGSCRYNGR